MINNFYLDEVLEFTQTHPRKITYLGIGSCPDEKSTLEEYTEDKNQLFPSFIQKYSKEYVRLIHIDPAFNKLDFTDLYFKSIGFEPIVGWNYLLWKSKFHNVEVLVLPISITPQERDEFCTKLSLQINEKNNKLFVQEYTGRDLVPSFRHFLKNRAEEFRQNIIWDITLGMSCHCNTLLSKYPKFFHPDGTIFNFWSYSPEELSKFIGKDPALDDLIMSEYLKMYKKCVMTHHLNYRRKLQNQFILNDTGLYDDSAKPGEIMEVLLNELEPIIHLLNKFCLRMEELNKYTYMLTNYEKYDVYKWYSDVISFFG
jgi:hypothetical protein